MLVCHCAERRRCTIGFDRQPFRAVQRQERFSIGNPGISSDLMETRLAILTVRGGRERGIVEDRSRLAQWHTVAIWSDGASG